MDKMEFEISGALFDAHPDYSMGLMIADAIDNTVPNDTLMLVQREAEERMRREVVGNVADNPRIAAWRDAYRRFGAKPAEHRSSIEAMARRVLKPDTLPSINPLVDIGNAVSLRYLLPVGVHPLPNQRRSLALRPAQPGDLFHPVEGGEGEVPVAGEIVLATGHEVLTRRWTWRQSAHTRIAADTSRVFVIVDGLPPASRHKVLSAMYELTQLLIQYCSAKVLFAEMLDRDRPAASVKLA